MSTTPKTERLDRVSECAEWLVGYIGGFTHPDREVLNAALRAGFPLKVIMDAKKLLRQAVPPLCSRVRGPADWPRWWVWFGERDSPPPDRPERASHDPK